MAFRFHTVILLLACSLFMVMPNCANAELPDPASHLKHYPILDDYFTFGMYAVYAGQIAGMEKYYAMDTAYLIDRQGKTLALHGINTVISAPPLKPVLDACQKYDMNFLPEMLYWYRGPFAQTKRQWKEFVNAHKGSSHILGWYVYDEPDGSPEMIQQYIELKNELYQIDPKHPVVECTSGVDETQARHCEYYMWDHYPYLDSSWTGGSLWGLKEQSRRGGAASPNLNVAVIQMTSHGNWRITPEQLRGQLFTILANGSNGVMFYSGDLRAPFWSKWRAEETYVSADSMRSQTASSIFSCPTPLVLEAGRIAERLVPAGYLLVGAKYRSEPGTLLCVDCPLISSYRTEIDDHGLHHHREKKIPAIEVGVWKRNEETILVVHNTDLENPQKGRIRLEKLAEGTGVYDLWQLKPVDVSNSSFSVQFQAADGQLYYLGTRSRFEAVKRKILKRTYEYQNNALGILVRAADQTALLDLAPVHQILQESRKAADKEAYQDACGLVSLARNQLTLIGEKSEPYKEISTHLETSRQRFYEIDEWLVSRAPLICDETFKLEKGTKPDSGRSFFRHLPRLEAILDPVRGLSEKYWQLYQAYERGDGRQIRNEVAHMAKALEIAQQELNRYRGEKGPRTNLGFVVLRDPGGQKLVYDQDAWSFIRLTLPRVEMVVAGEKGAFADETGRPARLDDYDCLWIHYSTPCGQSYLDRARKIAVPQCLVDPQMIGALKGFLQSGKGILLSGLAVAYADELGVETRQPNLVELDKNGFVTDVFSSAGVLYTKLLGLKKVPQAKRHPVFKGFDEDCLLFRGEEPGYRRNRVSWQYPVVPGRGNVLACLDTNLGAVPDLRNYDLVEFPAGPGRVIACGSPAWVFDTSFNNRGDRFQKFRTLQKLVSNIVDYLGQGNKPPFVHDRLEGPFCLTDIAKKETNPSLTWKVSSGDNGQAMYSLNYLQHWQTEEDNASTECRFGRVRLINKVCVLSSWEMSRWDVAHLRLEVKDEKTGKFVDLNPPAVFDGRLVWETARFGFNAIRTSAVRLVDIRRANTQSGVKVKDRVSPPIGIFKVVVYGE